MTDEEYQAWKKDTLGRFTRDAKDAFHRAEALAAGHNPETKADKLKLFTCQVIYRDATAKNTWFTVLDVDKDGAHNTCQNRVKKFRQIKSRRGQVSAIHITEIEGPFNAGQILHEER